MSLGSILRSHREEKGITIAEVAATTRINKKYIQALEDENFLLIPSQVFAKGFLKTYAGLLGIDPRPLLDELSKYYKGCEEAKRSLLSPIKQKKETPSSQWMAMPKLPKMPQMPKLPAMPSVPVNVIYSILSAAIVLLVALIAFEYLSMHPYNRVQVKANPPAVVREIPKKVMVKKEAPKKAAKIAESESTVPEDRIAIRLETVDKSWIQVTSGEKELYNETLGPGAKLNFVGRLLKVKVGNGGGVRIWVNGKSLGVMGENGVVVERTFKVGQ